MNNDLLSTIGLSLRAGRLELGEEPVGAACRARHARLLLLAADAADNTRRRAEHFVQAGSIPYTVLPFSKEELGRAVGRRSCAMLAITDIGMAAALAKRLAALDEGRYGPLVPALDPKAQKAIQRQKEQARHDRKRERRRIGELGTERGQAESPKGACRPVRDEAKATRPCAQRERDNRRNRKPR